MKKLFLFLIILFYFSISAYAESGTIQVSTTTNLYDVTFGTPGAAVPISYNKFNFDNTDFNTISRFRYQPSATTVFPDQGNSTTFTVTSGGTGSGFVSYSKATGNITWDFDTSTRFTSSSVVLTYAQNIFSAWPATRGTSGDGVSAARPMCIAVDGGACSLLNSAADKNQYYFVGSATSVVYTINYLANSKYNLSVDKIASTLATRTYINTSTINQFSELTYNKNSYVHIDDQLDGIYLNVTMSAGGFTNFPINTSGVPQAPGQVGTNQTIITKPSTGANVVFDKSEYFVGDNVNVSWYYSDNDWNDILSSKRLEFFENDVSKTTFDLGSQTGYIIHKSSEVGALRVNAEKCTAIIFCSTIGSGEVQILAPSTSWIAVTNITAISKVPFNATYHVGYSTSTYPPGIIEIRVIDKSNGNKVDVVIPSVFPDGSVTLGQIHKISAGNYKIEMYDAVKNAVVASTDITVVDAPQSIPVLNITSSNITMDRTFYFISDFATITYRVDDVNYTNFSIRADIVNDNTGVTTKQFFEPVSVQVGQFDTQIVSYQMQQTTRCELGKFCYFDTGNNHLNLVAYNNTNSFLLANWSFNVSQTTVDGWGVSVSKNAINTTEQFVITTVVPVGSIGIVKIEDVGFGASRFVVFNQTVLEGTTKIPVRVMRVSSSGVGYYDVNLYDTSTGRIKIKTTIIVSAVQSEPGKITPEGSAIANILSLNIFWALIVTVGIALAVIWHRKG